ncbi:uncharacterized protein TNCV_2187281, partial [Trichonephila clavipes]
TGGRSEPAPVNRLVVPSLRAPKRHCRRVSAADKGCRVYPLDPRPDAVALYSGCTLGKRRAWFLPDDRHTASLVGLRGGWRHARTKFFTRIYGSEYAVPGGVISEPDLLSTPESEILEALKLPTTVKAGYLNCNIRAYIPNPLRCFVSEVRHSQIACRGQLTCSRCASVGHSSADCSLAQKCVNCSQPHSSDSQNSVLNGKLKRNSSH